MANIAPLDVNIHAVSGSFQLRAAFRSDGLATAVFGHSGSGKTTLIHCLAGLKTPARGRISIAGEVVFDSDERINMPIEDRRVGLVFQESRLFPHLNVLRNLTYSNWAGKRKTSFKRDDIIGLLGLEALLERAPQTLSGGEKQRVAIGRALLSGPRVLLLDEPLASLGNSHKQDILPFLERVANESGVPICYVSHSMDEVTRIADDLVVLSRGRTLAAGPLADILTRIDLGGATGRHEAGALLSATVVDCDQITGITQLNLEMEPPLGFEVTGTDLTIGSKIRLRIRARDVALATGDVKGLSIRNKLPAIIENLQTEDAGYAEIVLRLGADGKGPRLRARITAASVHDLNLSNGMAVTALVKSTAIERRLLQAINTEQKPLRVKNILASATGSAAADFILDEPPFSDNLIAQESELRGSLDEPIIAHELPEISLGLDNRVQATNAGEEFIIGGDLDVVPTKEEAFPEPEPEPEPKPKNPYLMD